MKYYKIYLIISILFFTSLLSSCSRDYLGTNTLKKDYRVTLTKDLELMFSTQKIGFPSDGIIISIYEHNSEGTKFFEQFVSKTGLPNLEDPLEYPFIDERNIEMEATIEKHIVANKVEFPKNYQFDWDNNYSWKKVGGLYMIYFYELKRLYFIALIL